MKRDLHWWFAWWYLALAIGFILLGIAHIISGGQHLMIVLRFILAAGFGLLSWMEFKPRKPRRRL